MLTAGSVYATGFPQCGNPKGGNYFSCQTGYTCNSTGMACIASPSSNSSPTASPTVSSAATPDTNASMGDFSSWFKKTNTEQNGISTVPEDIWGTTGLNNNTFMSKLAPFMEEIGFLLLGFGFVFNMYKNLEKYSLGLESQAQPYFKLFYSFIFSAVFIYMWSYNHGGPGNIFYEYLLVINNMYGYVTGKIMEASIFVGLLHNIHHTTTVVVNEVHNTKTGGWSWNPLSWASAAIGAIFGYILKTLGELIITVALVILYLLYFLLSYLVYVVQLLFLGTLYAVFPIVVAVNYGEYAKDMKILANWVKWFIEVSLWGVFISLEFSIFAYIVGNHFADSNSIISPLTAALLLILMCFLPLAGPILLHKIFGLHGSLSGHSNIKNKVEGVGQTVKGVGKLAAGDPSGAKDIKEGSQKASNPDKSNSQTNKTEQSQTYGPVAGGVAPGVSDFKPKEQKQD